MTAPLRDSEHRRLDQKLTGLLVVTGLTLLILLLALFGVLDLATDLDRDDWVGIIMILIVFVFLVFVVVVLLP